MIYSKLEARATLNLLENSHASGYGFFAEKAEQAPLHRGKYAAITADRPQEMQKMLLAIGVCRLTRVWQKVRLLPLDQS